MLKHPLSFFEKHNLAPRDQQVEILDKVHSTWNDFDYYMLNAPTGVGKSYIACSIGDSVKNAYFLTSTLQLQEQYLSSWDEIVNLSGRSNYDCNLNSKFNVANAPCNISSGLVGECIKYKLCSYYNQKTKALASKAMITNPLYFLYSTHCGFGKDVEDTPWIKREVLIIDEAHNLDSKLRNFAESRININDLQEKYKIDFHNEKFVSNDTPHNYSVLTSIKEKLQQKVEEIQNEIAEYFPDEPEFKSPQAWANSIIKNVSNKVEKLQKQLEALDKEIQPLKIFFNTHSNYDEFEERWFFEYSEKEEILQLTPYTGGFLFHDYLGKMADKFIFLSATLGSKSDFIENFKLPKEKVCYIETDSPFDPKKSPIKIRPVLKLNYSAGDTYYSKMCNHIDTILEDHKGQRGIIHASSYSLVKAILDGCNNIKRFTHRNMKENISFKNDQLLDLHMNKKDSVLLSPSMMEGVDLHGEMSLFQIIVKMPWPSLGDPFIKQKSKTSETWYSNLTWLSLQQASGRSTRNMTDSSVTYILDHQYPTSYSRWKHNLPEWYKVRHVWE